MFRKGSLICLVSIVVIACGSADNKQDKLIRAGKKLGAQSPFADTSAFPRIYVDQYDTITLNGRRSSIEEIDILLREIKLKKGLVFYSSYNATDEFPKEGRVVDLIKKYRVDITLYRDSTFARPFH